MDGHFVPVATCIDTYPPWAWTDCHISWSNDSVNELTSSPAFPRKSADQKYCFSCGTILHLSADHCPSCGAIQPDTPANRTAPSTVTTGSTSAGSLINPAYCRGCGSAIHASAPTCPHCGAQQTARVTTSFSPNAPQKWIAVLLAIFLGGVGAHKFYLGRIGQGILYLLFFWTFIPALVAFVEGLIYLTWSEEEFARRFS